MQPNDPDSVSLLDSHPVSFKAYLKGSERCHIVTTVLDSSLYDTLKKRTLILRDIERRGLTAAVEAEVRVACRHVLSGPECPRTIYQSLTTIIVSKHRPESRIAVPGVDIPPAFTLIVGINPGGTVERIWQQLTGPPTDSERSSDTMVGPAPRRSRRLSMLPPAAPAAAPARRGRSPAGASAGGSRRKTSPAGTAIRRKAASPASSGARKKTTPSVVSTRKKASPSATRTRGKMSPTAAGTRKKTSPTTAGTRGKSSPAGGGSRRRSVRPSSSVSSSPSVGRSVARRRAASPAARSGRRRAAALPPPAPSPVRSALSPRRRRGAIQPRGSRSPSFAKEIRGRALREADDVVLDFQIPMGFAGSKKMLFDDLLMNPSVVIQTPSVLKRFSRSVAAETRGKTADSPRDEASGGRQEQGVGRPTRQQPAAPGERSRQKDSAEKRGRSSSRSPSQSPAKRVRLAADSPARLRPSLASVRKSLDSSLTDEPPAARRSAVAAGTERSPPAVRRSAAAAESVLSPPVISESSARRQVAGSAGRTPRRAPAVSPERPAGTTPLVTARSSIRRRAAGPQPQQGSAGSPALRPPPSVGRAVISLRRTEYLTKTDQQGARSADRRALETEADQLATRSAGRRTLEIDQPAKRSAGRLEYEMDGKLGTRMAGQRALESETGGQLRSGRRTLDSEVEQIAARSAGRRTTDETDQMAPRSASRPAMESETDKLGTRSAGRRATESETDKLGTRSAGRRATESETDKLGTRSAGRRTMESETDKFATRSAGRRTIESETDKLGTRSAGRRTTESETDRLGTRASQRPESERRPPGSALRRVLDRAPDSAARSSVRRVLRRPSPPPDPAAGGDSPARPTPRLTRHSFVSPSLAPVTRARRGKMSAGLFSPEEGNTELNASKPVLSSYSKLYGASPTKPKRSCLRTTLWLLLLLLVFAVGAVAALWLSGDERPQKVAEQLQQSSQQLLTAAQQSSQQLLTAAQLSARQLLTSAEKQRQRLLVQAGDWLGQ